MIFRRSLYLLLPCLFLGCYQQPLAADPLTQQQAADVGRHFCERVGAPVRGEATIAGPIDPGSGSPNYWQPCWEVTFPGQAELQISAITGVVQDYDNDALEIALRSMPAGPGVSAQQAVEIASKALGATGQKEQLSSPAAEWHDLGGNGGAGCHWWLVRWGRLYQSVPYLDQCVCVDVLPETGQVEGLGLNMPTAPPPSMAVDVAAAQESNIAENQLVTEGNGDMVLDSVGLWIVTIQTTPAPPMGTLGPSTARLAWVVEADGDESSRVLWVDSASGQIIGGHVDSLAGQVRTGGAAADVADALRRAQEIAISGRGARLEWVELAKWSAGSEGFGLFASASTMGVLPKPGLAPYKMALGSGMTLYYFPEQNLLGVPGCWLKVSPQLASLVKNLPVPASPAPAKKP